MDERKFVKNFRATLPFLLEIKSAHNIPFFYKLKLLKNCIKQVKTNLQTFLAIITNISETFYLALYRQLINAIYALFNGLHVFDHVRNLC